MTPIIIILFSVPRSDNQENNQNCANLPALLSNESEYDQLFIDPQLMDDDCTITVHTLEPSEVVKHEAVHVEVAATSPARSIFTCDGPKTPSLADMKLSKATRDMMAANVLDINSDDEEDTATSTRVGSVIQYRNPSATPESPADLDISVMSMHHSFQSLRKESHCLVDDDGDVPPTTPQLDMGKGASARNNAVCSTSSTPPTPDLATSFATCSLQEVTCSLHPAIMAYLGPAGDDDFEPLGTNMTLTANKDKSYDSDDSVHESTSLAFSPPKMAKILQPRLESESWIPLVDPSEWAKAPMSLKLQVVRETVRIFHPEYLTFQVFNRYRSAS